MIDQNNTVDESGAAIPAQAAPGEPAQAPLTTAVDSTAEAVDAAKESAAGQPGTEEPVAKEPVPEAAAHNVGRGQLNPIMHMVVDGKLVEARRLEADELPPPAAPGIELSVTQKVDVTQLPITQAMGRLIDLLTAANHPEPEAWTLTMENPANVIALDVHQTIFLVNRALRLLLTERRDIPVDERTQALLGIVNIDNIDRWLQTLEKATVPVMVKYNVGKPGFIKADELARERESEGITAPEEKV